MYISQAGAALIATVYPIGLLIVAVNRRDVKPGNRPRGWILKVRVIVETIRNIAVIGAVVSVIACVFAVSMDFPIRNPFYVLGVALSGIVIGVSSLSVLQDLAFSAAERAIGTEVAERSGRKSLDGLRGLTYRGRQVARSRSRRIRRT